MNQQFIQSLSIDWNKIEDDSYLREIEAINKLKEVVFEKPNALCTSQQSEVLR